MSNSESIKKGAIAAIGCIAMQIPFVVSKNRDDAGVVGNHLMKYIPAEVNTEYDGYNQHWWWDNLAHFLAGYAIGEFLSLFTDDENKIMKWFIVIAAGWESFEYLSGERPWHTNNNGDMEWSFDHAAEDTILDTAAGAIGIHVSTRKDSPDPTTLLLSLEE